MYIDPNQPMPPRLTPEARKYFERLRMDLKFFCASQLKIKLKGGGEGPFLWNKAQEYLHARIEDQLRRTGMVRCFVLKGRQQGISTYIAARFLHKALFNLAMRVFILSHQSNTTETLFQIVDKYYTSIHEAIRPAQLLNNNRRMVFNNNSQYTVGTAGTGSIARGDTTQLLHWSEVAYSENIPELLTGIVQTVADVPGTEILNESTAHGIGDFFHRGCMAALSGQALEDEDEETTESHLPYELIFIPWHWQPEYRAPVSANFKPDDHESDLMEMYGLDAEQVQWRRNKIAFFKLQGFGEKKFKQEYPFTVQEAFQASGDSLIDPELVDKARKAKVGDQSNAPFIISVDPARDGDRTVIVYRQGRKVEKVKIYNQMNEMLLAGKIANIIDKHRPDKVFVDITGACGNGAVDRLRELNYGKIVMGIQFSAKPNSERYLNKRAEMAGLLKEWFTDEGGCQIPDDEEVGVELAMMPDFKETSKGLLQLESKDKIKKDYGRSPDIFDAMMLSFAQPVRKTNSDASGNRRTSEWMSKSQMEANKTRGRIAPEVKRGSGFTRKGR